MDDNSKKIPNRLTDKKATGIDVKLRYIAIDRNDNIYKNLKYSTKC